MPVSSTGTLQMVSRSFHVHQPARLHRRETNNGPWFQRTAYPPQWHDESPTTAPVGAIILLQQMDVAAVLDVVQLL